VVIFGGTDLTVAVADRVLQRGIAVTGVVHVGPTFPISYAPGGVRSSRFADVAGWADAHDVPNVAWDGAAAAERFVDSVDADVGLAVGWYHVVPAALRARFPRGCVGLHASLLPALRGGAPLAWAMLTGAAETGVSLFELGDGIDDGPLYGQRRFSIPTGARIGDLVTAVESASLDLVASCVPGILDGTLEPSPQAGTPSYCLQRTPEDGTIRWSDPTDRIDLLVRAVGRPYPGARTTFEGRPLVVWEASPRPDVVVHGSPGQLARVPGVDEPCVVTGDGVLSLVDVTDLQGGTAVEELRRAANRRFEP
jgi:methionyl-tRNA formyltransferase